jgi:hypothetical protein
VLELTSLVLLRQPVSQALVRVHLLLARNWLKKIPRIAELRRYCARHDYARCYWSVVGEIRDHLIVDLPCEQ